MTIAIVRPPPRPTAKDVTKRYVKYMLSTIAVAKDSSASGVMSSPWRTANDAMADSI
jgi:hypothetical protein